MNARTILSYAITVMGLAQIATMLVGLEMVEQLLPVRFINLTEVPVYFAVYYRKDYAESVIKGIKYSAPQEGFYVAQPGGQAFLAGTNYTLVPFINFKWPAQACQTRGLAGECRSGYPRTVFFSPEKQDILAGEVEWRNPQGLPTTYLGKNIGSVIWQGFEVGAGETHLVYLNMYGFDPLYAARGIKNKDTKAGRLNACEASSKTADALRRQLLFQQYMYFGK